MNTPRSGQHSSPRGLRRWRSAATAVAFALMLTGAVAPITATADEIAAPDGSASDRAAASCWEIVSHNPAAASGLYWLSTPALGAPQQFYCDQTTSGGGWVLVGRGRDGWSQTDEGSGTPAQVRTTISGPSAFAPRQLSSREIDDLLNNTPVKSLPDGVRLHRATDTSGTTWQDATFTFSSPRDEWSWMFDNEQRVGTWTIGGVNGTGGQTTAFGSGNALNRVETATGSAQGYKAGFGFGSAARGTPDANSYIWAPTVASGTPRPFTQVFLRPKLMSSDLFPAIPAAGTSAFAQPGVAESGAIPTAWGLTGIGGGSNPEGSVEVGAFAEANGIVYVGGNFLRVQRTAAGAGQVTQSFLAAFDVSTGEWISSFRPVIDRQVKAIAVLPNGAVAIGGYFTTVNGQTQRGFSIVNPTTGATDARYSTTLINNLSGGVPFVRSLDVQGSWLYIGGSFTHLLGGTVTSQVYARAAARISVANGTPDRAWNPELNGTVMSLDASAQGDRVYFAGFFSASKTTTTVKGAAISAADASVIPWTIQFSNTANYQQAVKEVGQYVWIGGSEHMLHRYDRDTMQRLNSNIGKSGGDFQSIATDGAVVYAGCHCFYTNYSGAVKWPNVGTNWTSAEKINSAGAWDNATGSYVPAFSPSVSQRAGAGAWSLFVDSTGTTWFGGDYSASVTATGASQWSAGFVRFRHNDDAAPTTPSGLAVTATATGDSLTWSGSTDNRGPVTYQVLRNNRVVATTTALALTLPNAPTGTTYFVRAADAAGNWSASTPAALAAVAPPQPAEPVVLVAAASTWSYSFEGTAPATGWQLPGFDVSSWSTGAAPIGWGHANLGTTLVAPPAPAAKPIVSYYVKTFDFANPAAAASVTLTTRADDGIVVYVNGVEVARRNIDPGAVTTSTYANLAVSASSAVANPFVVSVDPSAFVAGANLITAEVHSNYRSTPSASFELVLSTLGIE
ncbi:MAG: fibrinogen-like YCDxxxxGGGW domain-containing protein [Microbacteriaceae bacterium]